MRRRCYENVVYDPRTNFNFHEHGARVLSLDSPRTKDRPGLQGEKERGLWGGKSSHELWKGVGGHGVIRFLANYSRVPLTSPICLDYPDGSGEPRDLKRSRHPLSFFSSRLSALAHAKKRARRQSNWYSLERTHDSSRDERGRRLINWWIVRRFYALKIETISHFADIISSLSQYWYTESHI